MNISRLTALALTSASALTLAACGQQSSDNTAPTANEAMSSGASGSMVEGSPASNADAMSSNDSMSASGAMSEGTMKDNQAGAMKDGDAMATGNAMTKKQ